MLLYKIKGLQRGHTKYLKACNLCISKADCATLLKDKALASNFFPSACEIGIMVFTLNISDTEATDIAPLISYLRFINKPKNQQM